MELKGSRMGFNLFNHKVTPRKLCETLRLYRLRMEHKTK